jgi:3-phenylpropionate/cinnamic acid dioxygenase small subunit
MDRHGPWTSERPCLGRWQDYGFRQRASYSYSVRGVARAYDREQYVIAVTPTDLEFREEIRSFLHREAHLLDDQRFLDWLALFCEDAFYWIPRQRGQTDAKNVPSIIYDDMTLLAMRVQHILHPRAHSTVPPARTLHMISGIEVTHRDDAKDECRVVSSQIVVEAREMDQRLLAGKYEHALRRQGGGFRIASKRVDLITCESIQDALTILL